MVSVQSSFERWRTGSPPGKRHQPSTLHTQLVAAVADDARRNPFLPATHARHKRTVVPPTPHYKAARGCEKPHVPPQRASVVLNRKPLALEPHNFNFYPSINQKGTPSLRSRNFANSASMASPPFAISRITAFFSRISASSERQYSAPISASR
jgi:hypothetical protein